METCIKLVAWWDKALLHLQSEPHFLPIIADSQGEGLCQSPDLFRSMARAVCGQQVNGAAAERQIQRVAAAAAHTGKSHLAEGILALDKAGLKACGLSPTKLSALLGLAQGYLQGELTCAALNGLTDEEILKKLTRISGVGPWTANMVLLFGLGRPDVFPIGDYGLRESGKTVFGDLDTMLERSENWRPYRSAATWLLWRNRSKTPIQY